MCETMWFSLAMETLSGATQRFDQSAAASIEM